MDTKKQRFGPRRLRADRMIALGFAGLILLGTLLLLLPFASRSGGCCGLRKALFTATSATCVTGLILADTWTQWSGFGQTVLLCLIEIGGMGFMAVGAMFVFMLRRKASMSQEVLMAATLGTDAVGDSVTQQKKMLLRGIAIQLIGAAALTCRFWPVYGFAAALKLGVFHAVSAFCNAGFDIFGFETPNASLAGWGNDPAVLFIVAALIVLGGLGFLVWDEVLTRPVKKWSVYTRLVLITTALLLLLGTVGLTLTEWDNPATLGTRTVPQKWLAGFFQSATTRTAGFDAIGQGGLTDGGKMLSVLLMIIGGSSAGTAGGMKTVTFLVIILFLWSRLRGNRYITLFHRTIPQQAVFNALTVFGVMVTLCFAGGVFVCIDSAVPFTDALYEVVSALATVGLTTGITPQLALPSHLLLIAYMFFGRVGILTISMGFLQQSSVTSHYKYAETKLIIG